MASPPTGTITFVFTDIEGSSQRWERFPDAMALTLAKHDTILREAFDSHGGLVFKTIGDAFCVAFDTAQGAVNAVLAAQRLLRMESWDDVGDLRVRMAVHTGAAEFRDNDYFGQALNRVSRILSAGHGGQTLLSLAAEALRSGFGMSPAPSTHPALVALMSPASAALATPEAEAARNAGRAMSSGEAIALALGDKGKYS